MQMNCKVSKNVWKSLSGIVQVFEKQAYFLVKSWTHVCMNLPPAATELSMETASLALC